MFESRDDGAAEEAVARQDERLLAVRAGLLAAQRDAASVEARRARLLADAEEIAQERIALLTDRSSKAREMPRRDIALEMGAALRESDVSVQNQMYVAASLVAEYPATLAALTSGAITRRHVDHILREGAPIVDAAARAQYEESVLARAVTTTPSRTKRFAEREAERWNPVSLTERFEAAHEERRVRVLDLTAGMSQLTVVASSVLVHGIHDRLTRQAKVIKDCDRDERKAWADKQASARGEGGTPVVDESQPVFDERTIDQIRADLLADLVLTGAPAIDPTTGGFLDGLGSIRAQVQITIPVTTLTGYTDGGGELDGRSPVDAATARRLAGDAPGWDRVMTDPVKGTVWEVDHYNPVTAQRRFLGSRDVTCRGPGCRRPVRYTQIDHNEEHHDGGPTSIGNLCALCLRHHTLKTETRWTVKQLPGGVLEFTSPLGFTYLEDPPTRVVFLPDANDASEADGTDSAPS